jgi:uncharacterized delta-60 repeat protein
LELLEERQLLSGFGPDDGAYIVEDRAGGDYRDVQIHPDTQAIVAVGDPGAGSNFGVARYHSDGSVDTSYGNVGLASPPLGPGSEHALALLLQPDGKAVVAGQVILPGSVDLSLARLNTDGSPDASFGAGGSSSFSVQPGADTAYAVNLQSTGKIVASGSSSPSWFEARFKADGTIDSGPGGFGQLAGKGKNAVPTGYTLGSFGIDFAVQPDDKLVAVGSVGGQLAVARYTVDGTLDKTFNRNGSVVLSPAGISSTSSSGVALQADGKIVVVGIATGIDGWHDMIVARFTAAGAIDTSFAGGVGYLRIDVDGTASQTQERARDVEIQPDGKIVVVGNLQGADATGKVMVARLDSNGTLDSTFGAGGIKVSPPLEGTGFFVYAMALQSDGDIIVAGHANSGTTGDENRPMLMRFLPTSAGSLHAASGAASSASHAEPPTLAPTQPRQTRAWAIGQTARANVFGLGSLDLRRTTLPDAALGLDSGNTISHDSAAAGLSWLVGRSSRRERALQAGRPDGMFTSS